MIKAKAGAGLLGGVLLVGLLTTASVRGLGHWLVVTDRVEHADTIVVLGGGIPFRAMEAAELFKGRWAPEVWLTRNTATARETALRKLGVELVEEQTQNALILEDLGVPASHLRRLNEGAANTAAELDVVVREMRRTSKARVILVTSPPHTRRVRAIWWRLAGEVPRAIVRSANDEPFDADHWWRHTNEALAVSREVFGLLNVWAGFPVGPEPGSHDDGGTAGQGDAVRSAVRHP